MISEQAPPEAPDDHDGEFLASCLEPFLESAASMSAQLHSQEDTATSLLRIHPIGSTSNTDILLSNPTGRSTTAHIPQTNADHSEIQKEEEYRKTKENQRKCHCWPQFEANPRVLQALCFILHIGLVLLHLILLVIYFQHWECRKVIPLGSQSTMWSIGIPAFSQVFVTSYSTAILVLTQQLSLRRNLLIRQNLTATHDNSMAWSGLGSSFLTLWRQVSVTASVWGVALITLYLAGISILHISTPTLLTLEAFNSTIQTNISTTLALPNVSFMSIQATFAQASQILPLVGQYSQLSTIGLHGSTVYDMLADNHGIGNVTVNSTTFDVYCDVLPNPLARGRTISAMWWNITADPLHQEGFTSPVTSDFHVTAIVPNMIYMALLEGDSYYQRNRVLYYSSVNFTDSQGADGSWVTLQSVGDLPFELQVMACRFFSHNGTIIVDAKTKRPVEPPQQKTSSTWGSPQPPTRFFDNSTEVETIMQWSAILKELSTRKVTPFLPNAEPLGVLDQFVAQHLGIEPYAPPHFGDDFLPHMELYQLENALANLTAALHWSGTQLSPGYSSGSFDNVAMVGHATISQPQLASRLKLNVFPISVGLVASVILLILVFILVRNTEGEADAVDSTGILHLIWLLRDRSDIQRQICQIKTPSADELRAAGMFPVRLAGERGSVDHEMSYQLCDTEYR